MFEARGIGYVFAVGCDFRLTTSGQVRMRADQAVGLVEARGWNRRSCGNGAKGRRLYDWAWIATTSSGHHPIVRRSIGTGELAYYLAYAPDHYVCSLTDLVKVAGTRWAIEDDFFHRRGVHDLGQVPPRVMSQGETGANVRASFGKFSVEFGGPAAHVRGLIGADATSHPSQGSHPGS